MSKNKVYIIILNYNGWADTVECLESILRLDYPNYQAIVVDNNSSDDSMNCIKLWANGNLDIWTKQDNLLRYLSVPPIQKPIQYMCYEKEKEYTNEDIRNPLILIQTDHNGGFAFGNNVGIKCALTKNDFKYVWILNNDTVVEKDSLTRLVEKAEEYKKQSKRVGLIGSKQLFYNSPKIINAVGNVYNKWFGTGKLYGSFEKDKGQYDDESILDKIDYIYGASMLVTEDFLKDVGLMCEDYFLYYEEPDWAFRGKKKGYDLGYCWQSKVYHKEGASIGSSSKVEDKSELSDYYGLKNRVVFTRKFFPNYLWSVYLGFTIVILNRIKRKQFGRIKIIWKIFRVLISNNSKVRHDALH